MFDEPLSRNGIVVSAHLAVVAWLRFTRYSIDSLSYMAFTSYVGEEGFNLKFVNFFQILGIIKQIFKSDLA
jgi:hypothetical protein